MHRSVSGNKIIMASNLYVEMQANIVPPTSLVSEENCLKDKKKRIRNPDNWKKEKRKRAIVSGQAYVNTKGELVGPRAMGPDCACKNKCFLNVPQESREMIFHGYYSLNSYDEQNSYLYGLIRRHDIQRKRKPVSERRTCSYKYYVRIKGKEIMVCKKAFASIHGISDKKIRTLCIKHEQNILYPRDNRGRHCNRPRKVTKEFVMLIRHHILNMLSGASGNDFIKTDKNQGPDVNISKLYKDFLQQYEPEALDASTGKVGSDYDPRVKSWLYFKVFHEEFKSMDFNTVKRKLSDLRRSLEVSGVVVVKKTTKKTPTRSLKSHVRRNHPQQSDPGSSTSGMMPGVSHHMNSLSGCYVSAQPQQQGSSGAVLMPLQLSMLGLPHLANGGSYSTPSTAGFPPSQPLNLQTNHSHGLDQLQTPINVHSMGSGGGGHPVMSSYFLSLGGHVPNLMLPVSTAGALQGGGGQGFATAQHHMAQQFQPGTIVPASALGQSHLAQGGGIYTSPQHGMY